jgi:hypothetical protein
MADTQHARLATLIRRAPVAPERSPRPRDRCRYCGLLFNAWLPWAQAPSGVLLFGHLIQHHRDQVSPYLRRLAAGEDLTTVVLEAYEVVEDQ